MWCALSRRDRDTWVGPRLDFSYHCKYVPVRPTPYRLDHTMVSGCLALEDVHSSFESFMMRLRLRIGHVHYSRTQRQRSASICSECDRSTRQDQSAAHRVLTARKVPALDTCCTRWPCAAAPDLAKTARVTCCGYWCSLPAAAVAATRELAGYLSPQQCLSL